MTDAERAVIDAARAIVVAARCALNSGKIVKHRVSAQETRFGWDIPPVELDKLMAATDALESAVRALPRPLSEQLAELRPRAVVEIDSHCVRVQANMPEHMTLVVHDKYRALHPDGGLSLELYSRVSRIISNPEIANG